MKKKISLDNIGFIIIILTIILLNIFIGSNVKNPIWIVQFIVSAYTAIYVLINIIKKKKNIIIKNKIDIFVLMFMFSTILPFIFKNYASLNGTINFILKYWSVYGMYILVRNIVTNKNKVQIIINAFIISSIIPIIFGIDKLTYNIFEPFLDLINAFKSIEVTRMVSTFGYANTFAIYLATMGSLAISQLINTNKKTAKVLYAIYIIVAGICIMLTQSKAVIALIIVILFSFMIIGIKKKKINKKIIIAIIIFIILFFIYFFIAIRIGKPAQITGEEKTFVIRNFEPNKQYEFTMDIDAESDKTYNSFYIEIVEITKYFSEEVLAEISFGAFNGEKTVTIKTGEDISHIEIRVTNKLEQKITINNLKINGNDYILEYKIIKDELVRMFTTFNFKNPSVWQRADYWEDGLKLVSRNWLIGAGGNAWSVMYGIVQEYLYYSKEVHSYILDIWISFGLLGIASYILIIITTYKNIIKCLKNKNYDNNFLAIIIGTTMIVLHSVMDFDLSFLIMEMLFFMFIAIINNEEKKDNEINRSWIEYIVSILLIVICIGNSLGLIASNINDETAINSNRIAPWISQYQFNKIVYIENNNIQDDNKIQYIKKHIKNESYLNQNTMYEIMSRELAKNIETVKLEDVKFLINTWENIEISRKYDVNNIQKRAEIMLELAKALKSTEKEDLCNSANEILKIIVNEYETNKYIILDYKRNGMSKVVIKFQYLYYEDIYNEAKEILKN